MKNIKNKLENNRNCISILTPFYPQSIAYLEKYRLAINRFQIKEGLNGLLKNPVFFMSTIIQRKG